MDHSYALAALYPYATQPGGEWAYQAASDTTSQRTLSLVEIWNESEIERVTRAWHT